MDLSLLERYQHSGLLSPIDRYFGQFLASLDTGNDPLLPISAAMVSRFTADGHVCIDLSDRPHLDGQVEHYRQLLDKCPPPDEWQRRLRKSEVVGRPGQYRPLVLDDSGRLYLFRYWQYERLLADALLTRAASDADIDIPVLIDGLRRMFPAAGGAEDTDWQKVAAAVAVLKRFCVITGGPGTGKTYTVARILALLAEQEKSDNPKDHPREDLVIRLAAPTGKAAARLGESIRRAKATLQVNPEHLARIPDQALTIHRLLGVRSGAGAPVHHRGNPLQANVVVIDEASMVDLAMMSRLVQALPASARVVLIGDHNQLASVQAGSILGDISNRMQANAFSASFAETLENITSQKIVIEKRCFETASAAQDCIVQLVNSHRFDERGGIGALSRAVNTGDPDRVVECLRGASKLGAAWRPVQTAAELIGPLQRVFVDGYRACLTAPDPARAVCELQRCRVLCAVRKGPFGVGALNRMAEQVLRQKGLIGRPLPGNGPWYHGRPILVTRNDYRIGLFNGDTGLVQVQSPSSGSPMNRPQNMQLFFAETDRSIRAVPASRITDCETVFAMTVHKSQGSEFDQVHLVLPDTDSPVLTRELIYTAITRARGKVCIWGPEKILRSAVKRRIRRRSGLREALWGKIDTGSSDL